MIRLLFLILWLSAPALRADDFPALHAVSGVAPDDVLNIRERPDAGSAIIGTLAPDASGVEVLGVIGSWALVNTTEGSGYAALRFLQREPGPAWNALQTPMTCLGTEPFWSLEIEPVAGKAKLVSSDDLNGYPLEIKQLWPATLAAPAAAFSLAEGVVVLTPAECSDGMSDRSYGISVDMFLDQPENLRLSGCCLLARP